MKSRNLIMDAGEFGIEQVKKEVVSNDFDEAYYHTDILKNGNYQHQDEATFGVKKPTKISQDFLTNECYSVQIKNENDIGTLREGIKREIVEEEANEPYRFCRTCNKSFGSETNLGFRCSCREQTDSINQPSEEITRDVKPISLFSTKDSISQLLKVKDETVSEDEYSDKSVSLAAPRRDSVPLLENIKKLTATNIPDNFLLPKQNCRSASVENDPFVKRLETDAAERKFQCKVCSKSFIQMIDLTVHERIGHLDRPFECRFCYKSFAHIRNFKQHESRHKNPLRYECHICKKVYKHSQKLSQHEATHALEKTFRCKICSKLFCTNRNLSAHLKWHVKKKKKQQFHCKVCSESLGSLKSLREHETVHSGEKPFRCTICSKSFCRFHKLKAHEKIHAEGKPFLKSAQRLSLPAEG